MKAKIGARLIETLKGQNRPYEVFDTELEGFKLRVLPSGVITYYFRYTRPDGRKTHLKIGRASSLSPAQAKDIARIHLGKLASGIDPAVEKNRLRVLSLRVFLLNEYGPWATTHRKTGAVTVKRIRSVFSEFLDHSLSELTPWLLEKWKTKRKQNGTRPSTINRDLVCLKAALSKAVEWELLESHPLAKLRPFKTDRIGSVRFLTSDEECRLRNALATRERRIIAARTSANEWREERGYEVFSDLTSVAYVDDLKPKVILSLNTGIRRGELFDLKWENFSQLTRTLTIPGDSAKNGQTRHMPLNQEALNTLMAWWQLNGRPSSGIIFPSRTGRRLTDHKKAWNRVLQEAQIEKFRWHDLRHHFASRLVMEGVDLNTVRELLGHKDIKMTLRYAHLSQDSKALAVARLSVFTKQIVGEEKHLEAI